MNAIKERWNSFSSTERLGLTVLVVVGLVTLIYRALYFPKTQELQRIRKESTQLQKDIQAYNQELVALDQQLAEADGQRADVLLLKEEVARLEERMITTRELGDLLGELSESGEDLEMQFETIKQNLRDTQSGEEAEDTQVSIDVIVHSPYEDLVNYMRRIERLSPFLRVSRFEVFEPAEPQGPVATAKLTLLTPLKQSYESGALELAKSAGMPKKVTVKESLFFTPKPKKLIEKKFSHISVTGITVQGASSTAIVNGEVMRVGDQLGNLKIKDIYPDGVLVSDGVDEHVLKMSWEQN